MDYCNAVLAGAPKVITNKLQRVMNAAARVLTGTMKFDCGLTQLMHDNLHWLDVPELVKYKVIILTRRYLIGTAPRYPIAFLSPRWHRDVIYAPPLVISLSGGRTVSTHVAFGCFLFCTRSETSLWNSLPRLLRDTNNHNTISFGHSLKTLGSFSQSTSAYSALGDLAIMRYTNLHLLTYLQYQVQEFLVTLSHIFLLLSSED